MILSDTDILLRPGVIEPFIDSKQNEVNGFKVPSFGLSSGGYDIRISGSIQRPSRGITENLGIGEEFTLAPGEIILAATVECITLPRDIIARIDNKSTWTRQGIQILGAPIEPGWSGVLTLTIKNASTEPVGIVAGSGIAQVLFEQLSSPCRTDYSSGKYQNATGIMTAKL